MTISPPERIDVAATTAGDAELVLRWVTVDDADAVARAVSESLEHLKPWMPWADARSADPAFQRSRLRTQVQQRERGEEWQYGLFADDEPGASLLGAFGFMTRRGPRSLEIGYWLHVDAGAHGYATRAAHELTETGLQLDDVDRIIIVCDEANLRSAAIPQRLGYTLERVDTRAPEAPGETGRMQIWTVTR